jgi:hypothetical protein
VFEGVEAALRVCVTEAGRVGLGVPEAVSEPEGVLEPVGLPEGVSLTVGVTEGVAPGESEEVEEGVSLGVPEGEVVGLGEGETVHEAANTPGWPVPCSGQGHSTLHGVRMPSGAPH